MWNLCTSVLLTFANGNSKIEINKETEAKGKQKRGKIESKVWTKKVPMT